MNAPRIQPHRALGMLAAVASGLSIPAYAITADGSLVGDGYGAPFAVQTVQTGFGDNVNELNAGYARVFGGSLFLMFTGNLEANGNSLNLFFDTAPGGQNPVLRPASAFDRLTFDNGFAPDYFTLVQAFPDRLDFIHREFGTDIFAEEGDQFTDVFDGVGTGVVETGVGDFFGASFGVGFDNSNEAGVTQGEEFSGPADPVAAQAVTTGLEFRIPLSALGNPEGEIKLMAAINGIGFNFFSNQFLPGLEAPQENLGSDGNSNNLATLGLLDFNDIPGQQFVTISLTETLVGDLDSDGIVGQADLDLVLLNWGDEVVPDGFDPTALSDGGPFDGLISQNELDTTVLNWGKVAPPDHGDLNAVPEPAAATIALGLGAGWLGRRRRGER
ncbi:MAG: hypothetical protein AAF333_18155 [Planctomycetota bacterium]